MIDILGLKPKDEQRLDSYALERLKDWREHILRTAPQLRRLYLEHTKAHLRAYLPDNELAESGRCLSWKRQGCHTG